MSDAAGEAAEFLCQSPARVLSISGAERLPMTVTAAAAAAVTDTVSNCYCGCRSPQEAGSLTDSA